MNKLKRFWKPLFAILCIACIIYNIGSVLVAQKGKYLAHNYWQNFPALEKTFLSSQYVSKHPAGWIPDETAFSYAGGKLIKGTNPILVVIDAPPLGKYLIGISTLVFNNDSIIVAIFGIIAIILLYLLADQVVHNKVLALIPVVLYSSEPIFKNQFIYTPLLDIFQLVFLLGYLYLVNKAFQNRNIQKAKSKPQIMRKSEKTKQVDMNIWNINLVYFGISSLLLGFFIATKFFISGATIIFASLLWTVFHKDLRKAVTLLITFPIAIIVLLATYLRVFAFGYSFHKFLGIQKYIFLYHKSQIILPFSVWPLLLLNRWYVWFGNKPVISDGQWRITWPIITLFSALTIVCYLLRKIPHKSEVEILMIWSVCYLVFLSSGQTFSRYLIILLPILYIISTYGLIQLVHTMTQKINRK